MPPLEAAGSARNEGGVGVALGVSVAPGDSVAVGASALVGVALFLVDGAALAALWHPASTNSKEKMSSKRAE